LPVTSTDTFRVPDLLALFEYEGRLVTVLIEVKTTNRISRSKLNPVLSLKPALVEYAKRLGLPLLVAWRCVGHWILFDINHARRAETNLKLDFERAARQNLLGLLAGDVFYRITPGTAIRMRIVKESEPDADGGFIGLIQDIHFENAAGKRIPSIPHLSSLFMFWDNEAEQIDEGDAIVQSFVVPEPAGTRTIETASRTLRQILGASAALRKRPANLQAVIHDLEHWVHKPDGFDAFLRESMKHGVVDKIRRQRPRRLPTFLKGSRRSLR
jgi:Holliday junction resolvase